MTTFNFVPKFRYITDITKDLKAVVTFSEDHEYVIGEIISFRVSSPYGMKQINNLQARVIGVTDSTITVELDTLGFDPFIYPVEGQNTPPIAVPVGSGIIPDEYVPTVTLRDAFDNQPID